MNIGIISSTFLFPQNNYWKNLEFKIKFFEVGNYGFSKEINKYDLIICILFLKDISSNIKDYNPLMKEIKIIAKNKNLESLFLLSSFEPNNLIKINKNETNLDRIKKILLKNFNNINKKNINFNYGDLDEILKNKGCENIYDSRNKYLCSSNFSQIGIESLSKFINNFATRITKPKSKVLILDCDNTLWGGIVGEEGVDNIILGETQIGKIYTDFQREIINLHNQGILLALASKNNEKDVFEVLEKHPYSLLKKKHFVNYKINWKSKDKNIMQISKDLNLGLDSFVFWDDNPLERNLIKKILPQVCVIEPKDDIAYWPEQLATLQNFSTLNVMPNNKKNLSLYKARSRFIKEKLNSTDELKYLQSIKLKSSISFLDKSNLSRASEMTLKTNQYNLRTKRYQISKMKNIMTDKKYISFLISLKDIYGEHGHVGLIILKKIAENKTLFIDTFLMSCRATGRYFESNMFNHLKNFAKKNKYTSIIGEYIKTEKNIVVKELLEKHGFKKIKTKYVCNTNDIKTFNQNIYD